MAFLKTASRTAASASTILRASRSSRGTGLRQWQRNAELPARRGYTSATESAKQTAQKAGGDLPWMLAAVGITVPGVWYLSQSSSPVKREDQVKGYPPKVQSDPGDQSSDGNESAQEGSPTKAGSEKGETVPLDGSQEPDPSGATKKRTDSAYGQPVGPGVSAGEGDEQAEKQEGFTNTDTKHSTHVEDNPEKSQKGEGTVETAKIKGTVRADRPQK